ncbi:MAG: tetratricopeptide repeat protein [Alphaproteobacteria bacterium]|nr:tetratricopeptide repeat protein [Alphaproteobacteria bacterium]
MSDIFREVDEEIRHERYKRLWDRFGPYLIAGALLIVVGTAAYRGWVYWRETEAQASGDVFVQAVRLAEEGSSPTPRPASAICPTRPAAIRASLGCARQAFRPRPAIRPRPFARFDAIAADSGENDALRDIARLRAGYVALDTQDFSGAADRLEPLAGDDNALRFLAREGLASAPGRRATRMTRVAGSPVFSTRKARRAMSRPGADLARPAERRRGNSRRQG